MPEFFQRLCRRRGIAAAATPFDGRGPGHAILHAEGAEGIFERVHRPLQGFPIVCGEFLQGPLRELRTFFEKRPGDIGKQFAVIRGGGESACPVDQCGAAQRGHTHGRGGFFHHRRGWNTRR